VVFCGSLADGGDENCVDITDRISYFKLLHNREISRHREVDLDTQIMKTDDQEVLDAAWLEDSFPGGPDPGAALGGRGDHHL
jgi:hypothetical protein